MKIQISNCSAEFVVRVGSGTSQQEICIDEVISKILIAQSANRKANGYKIIFPKVDDCVSNGNS